MSKLLEDLNEQQQRAVRATQGPVLLLAGAGSGKTLTLTYRIAYLLEQRLAKPHEILAVTFTNKAAAEMKHRVAQLLGARQRVPTALSTFHSLGARLLREHASYLPRTPRFTICDSSDSERLIRQALQELTLSSREWNPTQLHHRLSRAKNSGGAPAELAAQADSPADEVLAQVWARYEALLGKNDAYDFDDLLLAPIRLLNEQAAVRQKLQQRWRFLSVDEYQDTNPVQEQLLNLLLNEEKNICVVGDDYQAIYSWRGAKVDHILRFEQRFPGCTTIYLTQNYRSTKPILDTANQIIGENREQKHKTLWTTMQQGEPVSIVSLPSDRQEAQWVRRQLMQHQHTGGKLRDCFILYRTNAQSRVLEEEFLRHGVPYTIVGGFRFYDRREIKDALALLQLSHNPQLRLSLQRIADALWRGIGPKTIERWEKTAEAHQLSLVAYLAQEATRRPQLQPVVTALTTVQTQSFATVADRLRHLIRGSGYRHFLEQQPDSEDRLANIEELYAVAAAYSDTELFLQEVSLLSDLDTADEATDRVTCMTLHASKGLEAPVVYVVGCEEGLLPHRNCFDSAAQLEEERRLLYVGMTRAQRTLYLTMAQSRYVGGEVVPQLPSRFLEVLNDSIQAQHLEPLAEAVAISADHGDFITHPHFGRGVVVEVKGSVLVCVFEEHGLKMINNVL